MWSSIFHLSFNPPNDLSIQLWGDECAWLKALEHWLEAPFQIEIDDTLSFMVPYLRIRYQIPLFIWIPFVYQIILVYQRQRKKKRKSLYWKNEKLKLCRVHIIDSIVHNWFNSTNAWCVCRVKGIFAFTNWINKKIVQGIKLGTLKKQK